MKTTWILVADEAFARILARPRKPGAELVPVEELTDPDAHAREGELHHGPDLFSLSGFPETPHPLVLNNGPHTPAIAGFPLKFQALVTGEGGPKGTFSNVSTVIIP